jgi:hypothetical protein
VAVGEETYGFSLPSLGLPADGSEIAARAEVAWRSLKTLVWHERLAGSPTAVIHSVFRVVAPDELSYTIEGGSSSIIIGGARWDRPTPTAKWQRSTQEPPIRQPTPFWANADDARVLGSTVVGGRKAWLVSFFDPGTPAWFTATIDKANYRTLELTMTAASHFMHHVYGPFDAPLTLHAP